MELDVSVIESHPLKYELVVIISGSNSLETVCCLDGPQQAVVMDGYHEPRAWTLYMKSNVMLMFRE